MILGFEPYRNSLAISLIDPIVFLRGVDFSRGRYDNAPPSVLRGLLTLCLTKPTRISSIEVELIGQSLTTWLEGSSVRPVEMREENKLFSATQTFFQAPRSTMNRRASSAEPGLFSSPGEDGFIDRRYASSPSLIHSLGQGLGSTHFFHFFDPPRGRERPRSRISVDEPLLRRDHSQEVRSLSPTARDSPSLSPLQEDASILPTHPPHIRSSEAPSPSLFHSTENGSEAIVLDSDENKDAGDGWQEFKKGLYTFPISFTIPSYMPPTLACDYGSVIWRLKAKVHRPGVFTPKLSASREVNFVAVPSEDLRENAEGFTVERIWGDQMQYTVSVSGRMFPIGGTIPVTLTFLPMEKVKIYKISAQLDGDPLFAVADIIPIIDPLAEQIIFYTFEPKVRRTDAARHFNLVTLESRDKESPLLPLSQKATVSPLHEIPSEAATNLMGAGPWNLQLALKVPNGSGTLHFSNKNRRGPIQISHSLTIVIRVERGDDEQMDPKTGKRKRFDVILQMPVHILSSLASTRHVALPRYTEREDAPPPPRAQRTSWSRRYSLPQLRHTFAPQSLSTAGPFEPFVSQEEQARQVDMLYERSTIFERLITGQQSEAGVVPPAYSAT